MGLGEREALRSRQRVHVRVSEAGLARGGGRYTFNRLCERSVRRSSHLNPGPEPGARIISASPMAARGVWGRRASARARRGWRAGRGRLKAKSSAEDLLGGLVLLGWGATATQALFARAPSRLEQQRISETSTLWFAASVICWLPAVGGIAFSLPALGSGDFLFGNAQIRLLLLSLAYLPASLFTALNAEIFNVVILAFSCGLHANAERILATEPQTLPWTSVPLAEREKNEWDSTFVQRNFSDEERQWRD